MEHLFQVAFPGLGIGEFTLNKVAFSLFGLEVRWYGVIITLGIICAYLYASWRGRGEGISSDDLLDIAMFVVLFGIVGARLYYVLMRPGDYTSLLEIINIRKGGLAIYGGVIVGAITLAIAGWIKKINMLRLLDCAAPGVMLAQAIGRWGNFFNGEAFGAQTEIFCRMGLKLSDWGKMYYFHPTFLYESLWNLLGFALINLIYRKKKFDGQIALMYFTWYGFGRMFIEGLRTDSLYIGSFRVSQLVAAISFVVCGILLIVGLGLARRRRLAKGIYNVVYGRLTKEKAEETEETKDECNSENIEENEEHDNGKTD